MKSAQRVILSLEIIGEYQSASAVLRIAANAFEVALLGYQAAGAGSEIPLTQVNDHLSHQKSI